MDSTDVVEAAVGTTTMIPASGACTHITATRFSDFSVSEYRGVLAGAKLRVPTGEHRVTATAYPLPCNAEPAEPPWIADEQLATFSTGQNVLMLNFKANNHVVVEPTFPDETDPAIVLAPGSRVRTGRNGEDAAGPNFSLDGWELKQVVLPPPGGGGSPSETVLFSTEGALPYSARGVAHTPGGLFVFQLSETFEPLRVFDAAANPLPSWPVFNPTAVQFDFTDGLEAIDDTHFVRTGFLNTPINCDPEGANCLQSGIEILELRTAVDNTQFVEVVQQVFLPELVDAPLNLEYPVGVAALNPSQFAVTTLPGVGSRLVVMNLDGTVAAGPTTITGSAEGVFVAADGRIGALDYSGALTFHNADTTPRSGEDASYSNGLGLPLLRSLTWDSAANRFITLSSERRLSFVSPSFDSFVDSTIDLSGYLAPSSIEYRPDTNQLAVVDRIPPLVGGVRIPTVDFYDLGTSTLASSVQLQGIALPVRAFSIAYVAPRQQLVSHYRRPGGVPDASLDAVAFIHDATGGLVASVNFASFGFVRIFSVNYLPATDELMFTATDTSGNVRLVVTDANGQPRRSYRTDPIAGLGDLAPISSGPNAGDLGVGISQPSEFVRASLQ